MWFVLDYWLRCKCYLLFLFLAEPCCVTLAGLELYVDHASLKLVPIMFHPATSSKGLVCHHAQLNSGIVISPSIP